MLSRVALPVVLFFLVLSVPALAMPKDGCGSGDCRSCHALQQEEVESLLKGLVDRVVKVGPSEVPGLWAVDVEKDQKKFPVYLDFSKKFLFSGNVVRLATAENVTEKRFASLNRVDASRISLADALVVGKRDAPTKVVVFTDPECPFCAKLHQELKAAATKNPSIVFYVKLLPLEIHPDAYRRAKAIACAGSLALLEDSLAGRPVPASTCETTVVDETLALAKSLGITSTPSLVLPDGRVFAGYRPADALLELLAAPGPKGGS